MIPSLMILTGYALILSLAYYWMRRAVKAEDCARRRRAVSKALIACNGRLTVRALEAESRLSRIISQETAKPNATVARIIRIARGEG